jgi:hypothetical protein
MLQGLLVAICATVQAGEARFSEHFLFDHPERGISVTQAEQVLCDAGSEVIDRRRENVRRASLLVLGSLSGRAVHIVVSEAPHVVIITAYWPDSEPGAWTADFRSRRTQS